MAIIPDEKLEKILRALDRELGDSDPELPDDMTDEEMYSQEPLVWAVKEVESYIKGGYPTTKDVAAD